MALQSWSGTRVRKHDVIVANNYLKAEEVDELNRIVVMFLDYAEDQTKRRKQLTLTDWRANMGRFLEFNERKVLKKAGTVSHASLKAIAEQRYETFDEQGRAGRGAGGGPRGCEGAGSGGEEAAEETGGQGRMTTFKTEQLAGVRKQMAGYLKELNLV
jgi:hypothetical protein